VAGVDMVQWLWWFALLWVALGTIHAGNVTYDGRSLIIDGQHTILFSGSIHYPRSTPEVFICSLSSMIFSFLLLLLFFKKIYFFLSFSMQNKKIITNSNKALKFAYVFLAFIKK
jgi:hypothetical protein